MNLKKILSLALVSALALAGCKEEKKNEAAVAEPAKARTIKVGVMSGPESQVAEVAAKVAKEKYNLDVQLVAFTEYNQPNPAVDKGDLDINAMQHKPYLDKEIKEYGYKLVIVGNTFVYPIAGYSKKIKSLNELQNGATVALPSDATNLARSLILLEKQGLLKLKDSTNLFATSADVVENPKNLQIKEVDGSLLPRTLDDVDFAVINNNFAGQIGLSPDKDAIFVESKESPYVNIIVARENNKDDQAVKDFVKAYQTEEVYQEALKLFQGAVVKGW